MRLARPSVEGENGVNDLQLECELALEGPGGRVRLGLSEAADVFEALLVPRAEGTQISLTRHHGSDAREVLATQRINLDTSAVHAASGSARWSRLRFANIDNTLSLWIDGALVLRASYAENAFHPSDPLLTNQWQPLLTTNNATGRARITHSPTNKYLFYRARKIP